VGGGSVTYSDVINSKLTDLSTTAGNAVSDLSGVVAGADVLASQFVDVKNALQDLQDFAVALRDNYAYTPTGVVVPFAGASTDTPPAGWFVCNGASFVSVGLSAGDKLYDLLTGAGWSALPDLQGRTIIGVGSAVSGATLTGTLGGVQGVNGGTTTLTSAHIPQHLHSISGSGTTSEAGAHSHTIDAIREVIGRASGGSTFGKLDNGGSQGTSGVGNHSHTWSFSGNSGYYGTASPTPVSAVQPSLALNYLIKG
jgi:microcystin-dependent protein